MPANEEPLAQQDHINKKLEMTSNGALHVKAKATTTDHYQSYQSQTVKEIHEDFLRDFVDIVLKDAVFEVHFLF